MSVATIKTGMVGLLVITPCLYGAEFRMPGGRATGIGGTGVSGTRGAWATYYNPAALADRESVRPRIGAATHVTVRDRGIVVAADRLSDYDWDEITENPVAHSADAIAVADILRELRDDAAVMVGLGAAAYFQIGSFGSGFLFDTQAGATPTIDRARLNLSPPSDPNSLANNDSGAHVLGLCMGEIPLAYGHHFETDFGHVMVGGAVKFIHAITYDGRVTLTDLNADDIEERLKSYDREDNGFGLDLGLLYRAVGVPLRCGLLARNINSPSFATWNGGTIKERMQMRGGAEMGPVGDWLVISFEGDITENDGLLPGYKSRLIGAGIGIEGYPSFFAASLRLGLMKNVADTDSALMYTAGLGFGFKGFSVSINGAMSGRTVRFDDETFPAEARLALALESAW